MDLKRWRWCQPEYDELLPLGRAARVGETMVFLLGFMRRGEKVELCALEYDPNCDVPALLRRSSTRRRAPVTNRAELAARRRETSAPSWPVMQTGQLELGGRMYEVVGGARDLLGEEDCRAALLAGAFLRLVDLPPELEGVALEQMCLCALELRKPFRRIPKGFDKRAIRFIRQEEERFRPMRRKLTLEVGKPYPKPIVCGSGGERRVFYINDVSLYDWPGEMEKQMEDPEILGRMEPGQLEEFRARVLPAMRQRCPQGKRLVIVEYESDGVQPDLHLTAHLDQVVDHAGSGVGMMFRVNKEPGPHGLKLHPMLLEGPVDADTQWIKAELLGYEAAAPEWSFEV